MAACFHYRDVRKVRNLSDVCVYHEVVAVSKLMRMPGRPVHRYRQVIEDLTRRIEDGEWAPGARLPSETELTEEYGVSRTTVRKAKDDLAVSGLIEIRQGLGTYVASPPE
jgi:DNA-binding GntR family transcriptional regulator